jgi:hypothetical protein
MTENQIPALPGKLFNIFSWRGRVFELNGLIRTSERLLDDATSRNMWRSKIFRLPEPVSHA